MPGRNEFLSDKLFHVGGQVTKHQDRMRSGGLPGSGEEEPAAPAAPAGGLAPEQQAARYRRLEEVRQLRRDLELRLEKAVIETEERRTRAEAAVNAAALRLETLRKRQQELETLTVPDEDPLPSAVELGNCYRDIDRLKLEFFRDDCREPAAPAAESGKTAAPPPPVPETFGGAMRRGLAFNLPLMLAVLIAALILCGFFYWLWQ